MEEKESRQEEIRKDVLNELVRFDETEKNPFRVAVSRNFNGGDYFYGGHIEMREFGDTTIGYATSRKQAAVLLYIAAYRAEERNLSYQHKQEIEELMDEMEDGLSKLYEEGDISE